MHILSCKNLHFLLYFKRTPNKQMQPILTADSFRHISGQFEVYVVCAIWPDAVKTADLIVRCKNLPVIMPG
jgi:hypothetical protein